MTFSRKTLAAGVAALGLVAAAGGGIAWAASDAHPTATGVADVGWCADSMGVAHGKYSPMTAAAGYLGLSRADLMTRMHAGQSLADIASAQGKTVAGLRQAMVREMTRNLAADPALTPAQRTAILALMNSHLDAMITGTHMSGVDHGTGMGMDPDAMGSMMGGTGTGMMGH